MHYCNTCIPFEYKELRLTLDTEGHDDDAAAAAATCTLPTTWPHQLKTLELNLPIIPASTCFPTVGVVGCSHWARFNQIVAHRNTLLKLSIASQVVAQLQTLPIVDRISSDAQWQKELVERYHDSLDSFNGSLSQSPPP